MKCRSCGAHITQEMISLGSQPLANELLATRETAFHRFPLDVLFCDACHLGQLAYTVASDKLFPEYLFYSSCSSPVVDRARQLATAVMAQENPEFVIEVASNDGYLLEHYQQAGVEVLGIDPAQGPANAAARKGIPTVRDFFTLALAKTLPRANVVHAHNVLAHCLDVNDFVAGLAEVLEPKGIAIVEVPYLGDLVRSCSFDTIYHEHVFYFSYRALVMLFNRHGLRLRSVTHLPDVLGGSLRLTAWKGEASAAFNEYGLDGIATMQERADRLAVDLKLVLEQQRKEGKSVWGYGAAAKATVFLNYAGIDSTLIAACADETPAKQGKYIPGTGIKVTSSTDWLAEQPAATCIFTWNYAHTITHRYARRYQGKFITSRGFD